WLATVNRMSHPKLPEYELANVPAIPRDPGHSSAYNVGLGLSKIRGPLTFGIDAIYEPIWSYTWADAASPVVTATGDTIPVGGRTVENHLDRKSTRLNSSHVKISYAVFCLKKKKT